MTTFDPRAHLKGFTHTAHQFLIKDMNAVEENQACVCPGGVAKPAIKVVAECAAVNGMVAAMLSGGDAKRPSPEERDAYYASFTTREAVLTELEQKTQSLYAAIDGLDENTLGEMVEGPIGPMTRFGMAELPAMHMMYHDGQINYIQALNGDGEVHW